MKKPTFVMLLIAGMALAGASAASAHQVTPPGLGGACTTTLHAGKAVPAHFVAMPTAAANSPAVAPGFCTP
ncbi:MAG TPA: hypothetical protein VNJ53_09410 [Gaiellaceae bacterium]|nr:hypothetical protein [Gaiellaceae bacterium]